VIEQSGCGSAEQPALDRDGAPADPLFTQSAYAIGSVSRIFVRDQIGGIL
jgi:hypothetical protein